MRVPFKVAIKNPFDHSRFTIAAMIAGATSAVLTFGEAASVVMHVASPLHAAFGGVVVAKIIGIASSVSAFSAIFAGLGKTPLPPVVSPAPAPVPQFKPVLPTLAQIIDAMSAKPVAIGHPIPFGNPAAAVAEVQATVPHASSIGVPNMSMPWKNITGPMADFLLAEFESPAVKPTVLAAIASAEGGIEAFVVNGLKNALVGKGGILGLIGAPLDAALASYATSLVAQYGPDVAFVFVDRELHYAATALGG